MASTTASIPRFLLPQSGLIWRRAGPSPSAAAGSAPARIYLRLASSSSKQAPPSGPRVLAKPERFNPPSHGARLPKKTPPRHYGGDLSAEEVTAQEVREYPGMAPPKNTRAYWFLHSRWIHVAITVVRLSPHSRRPRPPPPASHPAQTQDPIPPPSITPTNIRVFKKGTLSGLAIFTFVLNFKHTSPFADMLPPASDFLRHPISSTRLLVEVMRLHEAHKTARINEKRKRNVEDVAKRAAYRKAHGLPDEMGLFNMPMAKIRTEGDEAGAVPEAGAGQAAAVEEGAVAPGAQLTEGGEEAAVVAAAETRSKGPEVRRLTEEERQAVVEKAKGKWLGIF